MVTPSMFVHTSLYGCKDKNISDYYCLASDMFGLRMSKIILFNYKYIKLLIIAIIDNWLKNHCYYQSGEFTHTYIHIQTHAYTVMQRKCGENEKYLGNSIFNNIYKWDMKGFVGDFY